MQPDPILCRTWPPSGFDSTNPLYLFLYNLVREEALEHVLEIGSASGSGTTAVLVAALSAQEQPAQLYCLEPQPDKFTQLSQRYAHLPWVHPYPYPSAVAAQYAPVDELTWFYQHIPSALQSYSLDQLLAWREAELALLSADSPVGGTIPWLCQHHQIPGFDLVVLDGAEYAGHADLDSVYGARLLVLDDINAFKNRHNYQRLITDPNYYLITENWTHQHGFAMFKRRQALLPGISVVVHTANEAARLLDCLNTLTWANEVLVVDMYSRDTTVVLAQEWGARVVYHVPVACVDQARNFGLAQVRHQWTLVVDADEQVPPTLTAVLQEHIQQPQALPGVWLPRQNKFFGQWIRYLFPDYQMRFFRSYAASWSGRVHEFAHVNGETRYLPPDPAYALVHHSYRSVSEFTQKQLHYVALSSPAKAQALQNSGESADKLAAQLRWRFEQDLRQNLHLLQDNPALPVADWLTRQLYLMADLLELGMVLEQTGQLQPAPAQPRPLLSGYLYLRNAVLYGYPFRACIASALELCDELIITYATDSEDQTLAELQVLAAQSEKIRLYPTELWQQNPHRDGETIRKVAEEAMAYCTGEWWLHIQADEVYHQDDIQWLRDFLQQPQVTAVDGFFFKVLHFYGGYHQVLTPESFEIGWYGRTIRLGRPDKFKQMGDAWTLVPLDEQIGARVFDSPVRIFHYGHARDTEAMRLKTSFLETLYHPLPTDFEVCRKGEFRYQAVEPRYLMPFVGTHPRFMKQVVARFYSLQARPLPPPPGDGPKPKILIVSRFHQLKKGYSITLNEIYKTGILTSQFEVHQLAWHYKYEDTVIDGIHIYGVEKEDVYGANRMEELLWRLKPDVVLLHADMYFFMDHFKVLQLWQGPVVGWFTVDLERQVNPTPVVPLLQRCNRVLALSQFGAEKLRSNYPGPLDVVHLGVNLSLFTPLPRTARPALRQELQWHPQWFVFLVVANNFWRKGVDLAVESFRLFRLKYPALSEHVRLYLHTEHSYALGEYIASHDLSDYVLMANHFHPYQNPLEEAALVKLYQASDVFLLTTLGEGFGMPLLEAQACGLPIIATHNTVIEEVVGPAGLLIDAPVVVPGENANCLGWMRPPDVNHAAELMHRLVTQDALRQFLGEQGLLHVKDFTWHQTAMDLTQSVLKCLGEGELTFSYPEPILTPV